LSDFFIDRSLSTPLAPLAETIFVTLTDAGKKFNRDWIFRNLNYTFQSGNSYAITGPNGSGKSTLLQVLASSTNVSEGKINIKIHSNSISSINIATEIQSENVYQYISMAAPYLELVEEMTVTEFLQFHSVFKPLMLSVSEIITAIGLEKAASKQIRYYSSGMKQRVKLAQAIFSNTPILLLDEPCTNLDTSGYDLYHQLLKKYCSNKMVIISSNDENEIGFCKERISMNDMKG
jgi:ABC-type multidrug transport system ATPase subunit